MPSVRRAAIESTRGPSTYNGAETSAICAKRKESHSDFRMPAVDPDILTVTLTESFITRFRH